MHMVEWMTGRASCLTRGRRVSIRGQIVTKKFTYEENCTAINRTANALQLNADSVVYIAASLHGHHDKEAVISRQFMARLGVTCLSDFIGYWTTCGSGNSRIDNSRTSQLVDWTSRGLDNSQSGQLAY